MPGQDKTRVDAKEIRDMPVDEARDEPNPMGRPGAGGTTGDVARPRDREAEEAEAPVEAGFTTTGPTGSTGGRSLYGMDETEEHEPADVEADKDKP